MADWMKWGLIGCGGIARRWTIPQGMAATPNAVLAVAERDGHFSSGDVGVPDEPAGGLASKNSRRAKTPCSIECSRGRIHSETVTVKFSVDSISISCYKFTGFRPRGRSRYSG